jgi:hypothetical protein
MILQRDRSFHFVCPHEKWILHKYRKDTVIFLFSPVASLICLLSSKKKCAAFEETTRRSFSKNCEEQSKVEAERERLLITMNPPSFL